MPHLSKRILASLLLIFLASPLICHAKVFVYMTFDDGISAEGSKHVSEVFAEKKVPATIFLVGSTLATNGTLNGLDKARWKKRRKTYELYKNNPFIQIGNHSFSHAHAMYREFYKDPASVYEDIVQNQSFLKLENKIVRLPGRNSWHTKHRIRDDLITKDTLESIRLLFQVGGFYVAGWDTEWFAPKGVMEDYEVVYSRIKTLGKSEAMKKYVFTPGHVVLLCHDSYYHSSSAKKKLSQLVDLLKNDPEIELAFINEYPGLDTSRDKMFAESAF